MVWKAHTHPSTRSYQISAEQNLFFFWLLVRILVTHVDYGNWSLGSSVLALTFACGHDNLKTFLYIILKFVQHVASNQFADKFNNGWENIQNGRFIVNFRISRQ